MKNKRDEILKELIKQDPSLKKHQARLKELLETLSEAAPTAEPEENFYRELRDKLLVAAEEIKKEKAFNINRFSREQSFREKLKKMKKLLIPAGSILALGAVVLAVIFWQKFPADKMTALKDLSGKVKFSAGQKISQVESNAFGEINFSSGQNIMATNKAEGLGAGGPVGGDLAMPQAERAISSVVPPFPGGDVRYVYKGEGFEIKKGQVQVLKRDKETLPENDWMSVLEKFDSGLVDLKSFSDVKPISLSFSEDKEYGLSVSLNFDDGSISIYENWQKWPNPTADCKDQKCFDKYRLKKSDVPSDKELVEIADKFMQDYGIDRDIYEEGKADENWKNNYVIMEKAEEDIYIPETISVIYQLKVNDQGVYDLSGNPDGVRVNINIRQKKAGGAYGITGQEYDASGYPAEENRETILKSAENGGYNGYNRPAYPFEDKDSTEVEIGDPKFGLVKIWNYKDGQSEELLVPCYIFPVKQDQEKGFYYRQSVIVPAVKMQ